MKRPILLSQVTTRQQWPKSPATARQIDRHAVVTRHNVESNELDGQIPADDGRFCFNA
jgi:hypothetical protein